MKNEIERNEKKIKGAVKERYSEIAQKSGSCCSPSQPCCPAPVSAEFIGKKIGYSEEELQSVPEDSNLGLGCGNPIALASLQEGETVLDLGAGAGFDCFLAARKVGKKGKVIGIDMTPEMVAKAKANAEKGRYENVEFRLGEIEDLPVEALSVDVIISNCVINLSPDKRKVFKEAFRVLKPGGRLMISDLVLLRDLPESVRESVRAYTGCIAGAMKKEEYLKVIEMAGFRQIEVQGEDFFSLGLEKDDAMAKEIAREVDIPLEQLREVAQSVISIKVSAVKPEHRTCG